MRTTELDRRRAIWRLPEFQADYKLYKALRHKNKITLKEIELERKWGYSIDKIIHADAVAKQRKDATTVRPVIYLSENPYIIVWSDSGAKNEGRIIGERLYLKVDLKDKTYEQLTADFIEAIKPYKDILDISEKTRNRKSDSLDVFDIYDLHHKGNLNKVEITRHVFKVDGNPVYDFDEKFLKRVTTALTNAETIIKAESEKHLPKHNHSLI